MKFSFCAGLVLVWSFFGSSTISAQNQVNDLKDKHVTIRAENSALATVFRKLIYEDGIPIGFERSSLDIDSSDLYFETNLPAYMGRDRRLPKTLKSGLSYGVDFKRVFAAKEHFITVDFINAPIEKVFDSIVAQLKNYDWTITDNVVNIYPKYGRDSRLEELLGIKVKNYFLGEKAITMFIQTELYDLPEFETFLQDRDLKVTNARVNTQDLQGRLPQAISVSNLTLREILNRLAVIKGGGWILTVSKRDQSDGKETLEIDI